MKKIIWIAISLFSLLANASDSNPQDYCDLFPSAAQGWVGGQSNLDISGGAGLHSNNKGHYGFDSIKQPQWSALCDGVHCIVDTALRIPTKPDFSSVTFSNVNKNFSGSSVENLPAGDYGTVTVDGNSTVTFTGAKYQIKNLVIGGGGKVKFSQKTAIISNTITIGGGGMINTHGGDANNLVLIAIDYNSKPADVNISFNTFYGYVFSERAVNIGGATRVIGSVTAQKVTLSGSGSISFPKDSCKIIPPLDVYSISITPTKQKALMCGTHTPTFDVQLEKNNQPFSGEVSAALLNSVNQKLQIVDGIGTSSGNNFITDGNGKLRLGVKVTNTQSVELLKDYTLKVERSSDSKVNATATYEFVPFEFSAPNVNVIAGKSINVNAKVLACENNSNSPVVVQEYNGTPSVNVELQQPTKGSNGNFQYNPKFSHGQASSSLLTNEAGQFLVTLTDSRFDCSNSMVCPPDYKGLKGSFTVKSRPWTFAICPQKNNQDTNADGRADSGVGYIAAGKSFTVNIKPIVWQSGGSDTAVIQQSPSDNFCNAPVTENFFQGDSPSSTISVSHTLATPNQGDVGVLSGTASRKNTDVNLAKKAIPFNDLKWSEVGSLNFFANATSSYLGMNINKAKREIGRFYPDHFVILPLDPNHLSLWTYLGTDKFAYLDQPIDHQFRIQADNASNNPVNNYDYFSENLQHKFKFIIDNNGQNLASRVSIENDLTSASQGLDQVVLQTSNSIKWKNGSLPVELKQYTFHRKVSSKQPKITTPDGPFGSGFGLKVVPDTNNDPVDFANNDLDSGSGRSFFQQPDFRYGRITLQQQVHGDSGVKLNVPLKVQYWDGKSFIANKDDTSSVYRPYYYCWELLSGGNSSKHSTSYFVSGKSNPIVDDPYTSLHANSDSKGGSPDLFATQTGNSSGEKLTEESNLFLQLTGTAPDGVRSDQCRLDSKNEQPWLLYNWRNQGDESPHTTVTFGIERGNDRVLFRGERGLTGL